MHRMTEKVDGKNSVADAYVASLSSVRWQLVGSDQLWPSNFGKCIGSFNLNQTDLIIGLKMSTKSNPYVKSVNRNR